MVDPEELNDGFYCFQSQADVLKCREKVGQIAFRFPRPCESSFELAVIGPPAQVEIVCSPETGFVGHGSRQNRTFQISRKPSHRCVPANVVQAPCVSYSRWLTAIARLSLSHLWTVLSGHEHVSGGLFRFVVEAQPESLGKQGLQHFQTLLLSCLSFGAGLNIVTSVANPTWSAANHVWRQSVCQLNQLPERHALEAEAIAGTGRERSRTGEFRWRQLN